ncbi:MAG: acyl-CoA reductase [Bacteroidota bacterium]|nr:acyl-CoA reductase [Bacteroidota bacterium]
MITLQDKIKAFAKLSSNLKSQKELFISKNTNPWFTDENISYALDAWIELLSEKKLKQWTSKYPELKNNRQTHKIGVITAGNIPLVGMHDFLSVLISGNIFRGKLSSKNNIFLPIIADLLTNIEPKFKQYISFSKNRLTDFDAIIATGSNNSARYFESYFGKYPHIIRKNRNSAAIISGNETNEELKALAEDIFMYFGLGCRNVSKLFIPDNFDTDRFFENIIHKKDIINHNKYANNYDYNRAIYLMNQDEFLDNGFALLKENIGMSSPVSVIYYERYANIKTVQERIETESENIQCVVAQTGITANSQPFGKAQKPGLNDYADNIDTIEFLLNINRT